MFGPRTKVTNFCSVSMCWICCSDRVEESCIRCIKVVFKRHCRVEPYRMISDKGTEAGVAVILVISKESVCPQKCCLSQVISLLKFPCRWITSERAKLLWWCFGQYDQWTQNQLWKWRSHAFIDGNEDHSRTSPCGWRGQPRWPSAMASLRCWFCSSQYWKWRYVQ